MNLLKVNIDGQDLIIKRTAGAYIQFKEMTGYEYSDNHTFEDLFKIMFCMLRCANPGRFSLNYENFLIYLDNHFEVWEQLNDCTADLAHSTTTTKTTTTKTTATARSN